MWLEEVGFQMCEYVAVEVEGGNKITLSKTTPPEPKSV